MDHSSWKAFIKLSLVSIPVRAYTASVPARQRITFHQLHEPDHNRIRYQKVCPVHGEVPNEEIVKGYEYAKDQYVIVDPDELERIQAGGDQRSVELRVFVHPEEIEPLYFSGKSYYLLPDGAAGAKPYGLLEAAMTRESLFAVGQVVLAGREELVALRSSGGVLVLDGLRYKSEVRQQSGFKDELGEPRFAAKELELTQALVAATTVDRFDLGEYRDQYVEKLQGLIEAKVEGKQTVVAPRQPEAPAVINLMDALRASVERATGGGKKRSSKRSASPPRHRPAARRERR